MSEPKVEIPARIALLAGKHLHHLGKIYPNHGLEGISQELLKAAAVQCTKTELNQALISAKIQESNDHQNPKH